MTSNSKTLEFLYGLNPHRIKLGLDPTMAILKRLGNPHSRYVCLHIGGTNGKGSVAAMAAAVLQASGYRVGLYTSPHLMEFRERIRVQGAMVPETVLDELTTRIRLVAGDSLALTFFEFTTALAFQYFAEAQVDVAVVEVGMGGRFDATNVIDPLAAAITNIALDHEQYLGHTLPEIAFEKAGIIKKGASVVLGPMAEESKHVIHAFATEQGAVPYSYGSEFRIARHTDSEFSYEGLHWTLSDLVCALTGDHQIMNAACALALLEVGDLKGLKISESAVRTGFTQVKWEGRLETIHQDPEILLDGAHNADAAHRLASFLTQRLNRAKNSSLVLVIGMMHDKNHQAFLSTLAPLAKHLVLTQASLSRAAPVQRLVEALSMHSCSVMAEESPSEALKIAKNLAGPNDVICITGSLILVGEMRQYILQSDYSSSLV